MSQAAVTPSRTYKDFSGHWILACLFGYYGVFAFCVAVATHATLVPAVGALGGGVILATFQWLVFRKYRVGIVWADWTLVTMLGCLVGLNALSFVWVILLPALDRQIGNQVWLGLFLTVLLLGCAALGLMQWSILRRYIPRAWHWIYIQMVAGALTILLLSRFPRGAPDVSIEEWVILFGTVFGLVGGTIMSIVLVRLLKRGVVVVPTRTHLSPSTFVLLLSAMGLLILSTLGLPTIHFPHKENLPIYPGARQVQTSVDRQARIFGANKTTFETLADPQEIGAFYESALTQDGWESQGLGHTTDRPNITVGYFHARDWDCAAHSLDLELTPAADGVTQVKLLVYASGCY